MARGSSPKYVMDGSPSNKSFGENSPKHLIGGCSPKHLPTAEANSPKHVPLATLTSVVAPEMSPDTQTKALRQKPLFLDCVQDLAASEEIPIVSADSLEDREKATFELLWLLGALPAGTAASKGPVSRLPRLSESKRQAMPTESTSQIQDSKDSVMTSLSTSIAKREGGWTSHGGYRKPRTTRRGAPVRAGDCEPGRHLGCYIGAQYTQPIIPKAGHREPRCRVGQFRRTFQHELIDVGEATPEAVESLPSSRKGSKEGRPKSPMDLRITADMLRSPEVSKSNSRQPSPEASPRNLLNMRRRADVHRTSEVAFDVQLRESYQCGTPTSQKRCEHICNLLEKCSEKLWHEEQHGIRPAAADRRHSPVSHSHSPSPGQFEHQHQSDRHDHPQHEQNHHRHAHNDNHFHNDHHRHQEHTPHHERRSHPEHSLHHQHRASYHGHNPERASLHNHPQHHHDHSAHLNHSDHHHESHSAHHHAQHHNEHDHLHIHVHPHHHHHHHHHNHHLKIHTHSFLHEYKIGEEIGNGKSCTVHSCIKYGSDVEIAVKMIDKSSTPSELIAKEIQFLDSLRHSSIVQPHEVCVTKCFVCILMNRYIGGTLLQAAQHYVESNGGLPCDKLVPIVKQIFLPVCYLHSKQICHLDLKGDNYLLEHSSISDPQLKIVLTDFGTARKLKDGERLSFQVGTPACWAPEVWKRNYGLKSDVWALGVLTYVLYRNQWPFAAAEGDICKRELSLAGTPPRLVAFLNALMAKDETRRLAAEHASGHPWLTEEAPPKSKEQATLESLHQDASSILLNLNTRRRQTTLSSLSIGQQGLLEDFAKRKSNTLLEDDIPIDVIERRRELVERLEKTNPYRQGGARSSHTHSMDFKQQRFEIKSRGSISTAAFEWWRAATVRATHPLHNMSGAELVSAADVDARERVTVIKPLLQQILTSHDIDCSQFGQDTAKSLDDFAEELQNGHARLMLDAAHYKRLVRVVDVLTLRIVHRGDRHFQYLLETKEQSIDGHIVWEGCRLPAVNMRPSECRRTCAERMLFERMNMTDCEIAFDHDASEVFEEEEESSVYPGVKTVYRKHFLEGMVTTTKEDNLHRIGFNSYCAAALEGSEWKFDDFAGITRSFTWLQERQIKAKHIMLKAPYDEVRWQSSLTDPPVGMSEEALRMYLHENNVDPSRYSKKPAKSLGEFASELRKGDCALAVDDGGLIRFVDEIQVCLHNKNSDEVLVEEIKVGGRVAGGHAFPNFRKRPMETQYAAEKKLITQKLKMSINAVKISAMDVKIFEQQEEDHGYPGVLTIRRRRIVNAELVSSTAMLAVASKHHRVKLDML